MKLSSTIIKSLRRCVKPLAITAISIWALVVTLPVAAQVYTSYSALDGGPGAPSYSFNSNTSSGMFRDPVANAVAFAVAGAENLRLLVGSSTVARATVVTGHLVAGGAEGAPALTTCGTAPTITGSDFMGVITIGTGTPAACTLTFAKTFVTAPVCYFNDRTTVNVTNGTSVIYKVVEAAASVTVTFAINSVNADKIGYFCISNS